MPENRGDAVEREEAEERKIAEQVHEAFLELMDETDWKDQPGYEVAGITVSAEDLMKLAADALRSYIDGRSLRSYVRALEDMVDEADREAEA